VKRSFAAPAEKVKPYWRESKEKILLDDIPPEKGEDEDPDDLLTQNQNEEDFGVESEYSSDEDPYYHDALHEYQEHTTGVN
jgi:hypothetical protein